MKKIFTFALGLVAMMSAVTAVAETKTVASKNDFVAFADKERTPETVDTMYVKGYINVGNYYQKAEGMRGNLYVIGIPDDKGTAAELHMGWNLDGNKAYKAWNSEADNYSLFIQDIKLSYRAGAAATSGQFFYDDANGAAHIDSLSIDNCELYDIPRTFLRTVCNGDTLYGTFNYLGITNSDIHYMNIQKGNEWYFIVLGSSFGEINISNNTFYDMPFTKGLIQMSHINPEYANIDDAVINIENNDFFIANNQSTILLDFGNTLGQMTVYNINNNVFHRPQWESALINVRPTKDKVTENEDGTKDTTTVVVQQQIFRAQFGLLYAKGNVIDSTYRESSRIWADDALIDTESGEGAFMTTEEEYELGIDPATVGLTWDNLSFASDGNFIRAKSLAAFTAGVNGKPIGNPNNYVDNMPTKTTVNVTIEGSNTVDYEILPAGPYFVGDEVTIQLNLKNTNYLKINKFIKWEDGSTEPTRTVTLGETNNFVATIEGVPVYAAFTFPAAPAAGQNKCEIFNADAAAEGVTATAQLMFAPEGGDYRLATADDQRFQWRGAKFGEDAEDKQMSVLSRRTLPDSRLAGKMDYVIFSLNTTSAKGLTFSCYVGTDNIAWKKQLAEYSIDGGATWKALASVELEPRKATFASGEGELYGWAELKGTLPAEAEGLEDLKIRVIGDVTSELIANSLISITDEANTFEYLGSVLITAESASGIKTIAVAEKPVVVEDNAPVYNILGQRVVNPAAGQLYIKSGKKFFVK
jgi:hypothetical protein